MLRSSTSESSPSLTSSSPSELWMSEDTDATNSSTEFVVSPVPVLLGNFQVYNPDIEAAIGIQLVSVELKKMAGLIEHFPSQYQAEF